MCKTGTISLDDLPSTFQESFSEISTRPDFQHLDTRAWEGKTLAQVKEEVLGNVEKKYIEMTLEKTSGRVVAAAKIAGIHPRGLYGKMKKLVLTRQILNIGMIYEERSMRNSF